MSTFTIAAASSSSSIVDPQKDGVFLSFRGSDTRYTFVSHLYRALRLRGIPAFRDSEDLQKERGSPHLLDEIRKSNFSVVILSTNYAYSSWCLNELAMIMGCWQTQEQPVVPVFYHVDPADVKNQTGSYGKAFAEHQAAKVYPEETLLLWRNALTRLGNLSGFELRDGSSEAQVVYNIVRLISESLRYMYPGDLDGLVGEQQRFQRLESLCIEGVEDILRRQEQLAHVGYGHDVFLSFKGSDTRNDFVRHLYSALCLHEVSFIDSEEFERGNKVSAVLNEIEKSKVSIVVLSENYASSRWCLDELVKIMECRETRKQRVIPVFYHVGKEDNSYRRAFTELQSEMKENIPLVRSWWDALRKVAEIPEEYILENNRRREIVVTTIAESLKESFSSDNTADIQRVDQSPRSIRRHGVFLSFRGEDTRSGFVSHLYGTLCQRGIPTFIDSRESGRGKSIWTILSEIEQSSASIVIFSNDYASSTFCLRELEKILECRRKGQEHLVLPVFYHVDPSNVREQTGSYRKAMATHEINFEEDKAKVRSWKTALTEAGQLGGWVQGNNKPETETINQILSRLESHLRYGFENLVGGHPRIKQVESLLGNEGRADIRVVGILGMSGIGKTTLVKVVFDMYSSQFEGSYFRSNVTEELGRRGPREIHSELQGLRESKTSLNRKEDQLHRKKVLIVLDDVSRLADFICLVERRDLFGAGSRIIVTSRDRQLLENIVDLGSIYEVPALNSYEAFELFRSLACEGGDFPFELAEKVIGHLQGNPLALTILGLSLQGKSIQEWEGALVKLERAPQKEVRMALRISFYDLDFHDQQIFLDIACFLKGKSKYHVARVLYARGFSPVIGLENLAYKYLITVSSSTVDMHDFLQEMAKEIVCEECIMEPGNRSRLWDDEDICHVLTKETGTEKVEGISLDLSKVDKLQLSPTTFMKMKRLQLLNFYSRGDDRDRICFHEGLAYLPDELRYLRWNHYPLESLPSSFAAKNLVELDMSYSDVEQLWTGRQDIRNLYLINLRDCEKLKKIPDLSMARKLEILNCEGCGSLQEVSPSIQCTINLVELILRRCSLIEGVPSTKMLRAFKRLDLRGCSKLNMFPVVARSIEELSASETAIEEVPSPALESLIELQKLDLSCCRGLKFLPDSLGSLTALHTLDLCGCDILENIPPSIKELPRLQSLNIKDCLKLEELPEVPPSLIDLHAEGCTSLNLVQTSSGSHLRENQDRQACFHFTNCGQLNDDSRKNILNHAKELILHLATVSKENNIIDEGDLSRRGRGLFCVRGDEIPEWIPRHCNGSSITIELFENWYTDDFLGFVLCAVFDTREEISTENDQNLGSFRWEAQFRPKIGESHCTYDEIQGRLHKSPHLYLLYSSLINRGVEGEESNYVEFSFEVCSTEISGVKKVGVRLLYREDRREKKRRRDDIVTELLEAECSRGRRHSEEVNCKQTS